MNPFPPNVLNATNTPLKPGKFFTGAYIEVGCRPSLLGVGKEAYVGPTRGNGAIEDGRKP